MSTRHRFLVPDDLEGSRLDRCLAALQTDWTRSRARKLIDGGFVLLGDSTVKASTVVHAGDEITVDEPDPQPLDAAPEDIPLDILYEDSELLILNKPTGMVIHPAAGNPSGTLVNALLHHCSDLSGIGGVERPGIVHRLDKDTTGLLIVAKTDRAHLNLSIAFRQRKVHKTYLGVCYGTPESTGVIDAPIDRNPRERQQMAVVSSGRPARTLYEVISTNTGMATVACKPISGRTHQIRVHMAHIGHALVGDALYSGRQWRNLSDPTIQAACRSFPRQALHAWRIGFTHPVSGDDVEFEAPVPDDLRRLIEILRLSLP